MALDSIEDQIKASKGTIYLVSKDTNIRHYEAPFIIIYNANCLSLTLSHGQQKFWTGAGLYGLGAVTGNSGLKNVGGGLVKLGVLSKVGAHFL